MEQIHVIKRNGEKHPVSLDKIYKVLAWAEEGLNVSVSEVEFSLTDQLYEGITTAEIHKILYTSAANLISKEYPDYQYLAARLAIFALRKEVYGQFEPPHLSEHLTKMIADNQYDSLLEVGGAYSALEVDTFNHEIKHERDMDLAWAGYSQLRGKYLVQDRTTDEVFETPNMAYMCLAMAMYSEAPDKSFAGSMELSRVQKVINLYDKLSQSQFSFPTPIMAGVRTTVRQFSSCVLIEAGDSLASINAAGNAVTDYASKRAGIGLNGGAIRAEHSPVGRGAVSHTGQIPFIKKFKSDCSCCSQGGIRKGSMTYFVPWLHRDFANLVVLKNNRGVDENRCRELDYGIQLNGFLLKRFKEQKTVALFCPNDVPDLWASFYADQEKFARLYEMYEADTSIKRNTVTAEFVLTELMKERSGTGRIYVQFVDTCNINTPFNPAVAPIKQSNLCLEIALPTKPISAPGKDDGEIALCTLAAFNLLDMPRWPAKRGTQGFVNLKELAHTLVEALDALLDYQDYLNESARRSTMKYRPLGIGVINYAAWLARHNLKWGSPEALAATDALFDSISLALHESSINLGIMKKGVVPATDLAMSIIPRVRTGKKIIGKIDELLNHARANISEADFEEYHDYKRDSVGMWAELQDDYSRYGIRNATLMALMPSETSSQIANATNGIEPPRALVSAKQSGDGVIRQVVPMCTELQDSYEFLWDLKDNKKYLSQVAIMQVYVDQTISTNTSYDPESYPKGKLPMKVMLQDLFYAYMHGIKTLYYHQTRDRADEAIESGILIVKEDDGCDGGACKI